MLPPLPNPDWPQTLDEILGLFGLALLPILLYAQFLSRSNRWKGLITPSVVLTWIILLSAVRTLLRLYGFGDAGNLLGVLELAAKGNPPFMLPTLYSIVIADGAYEFVVIWFLASRLTKNVISTVAAATCIWLLGAVGYLFMFELLLKFGMPPINVDSERGSNLPFAYFFSLVIYVAIALGFFATDFVVYRQNFRLTAADLSKRRSLKFLIVPPLIMLLGLSGFIVLDAWRATLWLLFLIISVPVTLSVVSVLSADEQFSPQLVIRMFEASLSVFRRKDDG
jgi:hypothetical protein